jgi:hypothetical protein
MKPQNVTDHDHFFAYGYDHEDDVTGRYDACDTRDDGAGVWSPSTGMWWPMESYDKAKRVAEEMAKAFGRFNPLVEN